MIGHKNILTYFTTAKEKGTLSHAYLLVGAEHVGKRTLAETVSADLLGIDIKKISTHPDVRIVSQERNEKSGKLQKDIGISQIREVRSFAASGPVIAEHAIIILDGAERLSKSAANGFLKTLEEPHPKTIIFVLVTDTSLVPATIVSRCQSVYVPLVPDADMYTALGDHEHAQEIIAAAAGRPGIAVTLMSTTAFEEYQRQVQEFASLFTQPLFKKRDLISYLFDKKDDHIAGRQDIIDRIRIWKVLVRDQQISATQKVVIYDTITEVETLLMQNVHPRAAMDLLLLAIP